MSPRVQRLQKAVETVHKCKAAHVSSELVVESFKEKTMWEGIVEAFELTGHPEAKRCYAWCFYVDAQPHYTTVLELPPVHSAKTAVKVAIASQATQ